MADLPDYIPEAAARAYAGLRENYADSWLDEDVAVLDRLLFRPCMEKVYRALVARFPSDPGPWLSFLAYAVAATWPARGWRNHIRPARRRLEQDRAAALRAGRELLAALERLTEAFHGLLLPNELKLPAALLQQAAIRNGYTPEDACHLADHIERDLVRRLTAQSEAAAANMAVLKAAVDALDAGALRLDDERLLADLPSPPAQPTVTDLLAALLDALAAWTPEPGMDLFPGQTQGGKPPQVYVRALAHWLKQLAAGLGITPPNGRLLSYDNLARVTRAALDLPDEPPGYPYRRPFEAEDVRRALEVPAE